MITWFAGQPLGFKIVLGGLGALLLLFFYGLLWRLWLRKYLEWRNVKSLEIKERVGLKIEFIKTAAQILGGAFFLVTIYVAWANLVVSQEKHKTDLFTKAIEQLGSEKLEVRLGGIYALERIARDSEKDHGPIMEVLTAFVRLHAPWTPEKAAAAKEQQDKTKKLAPGEKEPETKEARRSNPGPTFRPSSRCWAGARRTFGKGEAQRLDLRQTDLRGADLEASQPQGGSPGSPESPLGEGVPVGEPTWRGRTWRAAQLERANLVGATPGGKGRPLIKPNLEGAVLEQADLEAAYLGEAHLERADLVTANLDQRSLPNEPTWRGRT